MLPPTVGRQVAEGAGELTARLPLLAPGIARRREAVARNLRRVCGPGPAEGELHRMVGESFGSYGRYWADSLRLPYVTTPELCRGMTTEGFEHIEAGEEAGRGTILALPHLGGWEWAGAWLVQTGHPTAVVAEALRPPEVFEWFVSFRARLGMEVIPTGPGAAAACSKALAQNKILCLLCDRVVGGAAAVEVEFFGEKTLLPAGPAVLALRTGAALLPTAAYFGRGAIDHHAVILPSVPVARDGSLRSDVAAGTQLLAHDLETLIRRAPTQWHLMQPNWPSDLPQFRP